MSRSIFGLGEPGMSLRPTWGTVTVSLKVTVISILSPVVYQSLEIGDDVISMPVT